MTEFLAFLCIVIAIAQSKTNGVEEALSFVPQPVNRRMFSYTVTTNQDAGYEEHTLKLWRLS